MHNPITGHKALSFNMRNRNMENKNKNLIKEYMVTNPNNKLVNNSIKPNGEII